MAETNIDKNTGTWRLLFVRLPGQLPFPAGILLHDIATDDLHIALVESISDDPQIAEIWSATSDQLQRWTLESGGFALLTLMDGFSHFLELEPTKHPVELDDLKSTLAALFAKYVLPTKAAGKTGAGD